MVLSEGEDWSVHRGGTIYLTNTKNITIKHHLFTQLGSNGVAVIDYNDATTISLNEFVWLADSGIILFGTTNGIDGFIVASQPTHTIVQSNLFHETGIYIKQSSPVLITITRSVTVMGNLMFNMPRAAININDGFYDNYTIGYNVIFNTVRETSDRQPYLSDAMQPGVPSLRQHNSYIPHNVPFNNYNSFYPIDHDDGSCFYEDSYHFQVYGGKKICVYPYTKSSQGTDVCIMQTKHLHAVLVVETKLGLKIPVYYIVFQCHTIFGIVIQPVYLYHI
jgi:hypothetical protein